MPANKALQQTWPSGGQSRRGTVWHRTWVREGCPRPLGHAAERRAL